MMTGRKLTPIKEKSRARVCKPHLRKKGADTAKNREVLIDHPQSSHMEDISYTNILDIIQSQKSKAGVNVRPKSHFSRPDKPQFRQSVVGYVKSNLSSSTPLRPGIIRDYPESVSSISSDTTFNEDTFKNELPNLLPENEFYNKSDEHIENRKTVNNSKKSLNDESEIIYIKSSSSDEEHHVRRDIKSGSHLTSNQLARDTPAIQQIHTSFNNVQQNISDKRSTIVQQDVRDVITVPRKVLEDFIKCISYRGIDTSNSGIYTKSHDQTIAENLIKTSVNQNNDNMIVPKEKNVSTIKNQSLNEPLKYNDHYKRFERPSKEKTNTNGIENLPKLETIFTQTSFSTYYTTDSSFNEIEPKNAYDENAEKFKDKRVCNEKLSSGTQTSLHGEADNNALEESSYINDQPIVNRSVKYTDNEYSQGFNKHIRECSNANKDNFTIYTQISSTDNKVAEKQVSILSPEVCNLLSEKDIEDILIFIKQKIPDKFTKLSELIGYKEVEISDNKHTSSSSANYQKSPKNTTLDELNLSKSDRTGSETNQVNYRKSFSLCKKSPHNYFDQPPRLEDCMPNTLHMTHTPIREQIIDQEFSFNKAQKDYSNKIEKKHTTILKNSKEKVTSKHLNNSSESSEASDFETYLNENIYKKKFNTPEKEKEIIILSNIILRGETDRKSEQQGTDINSKEIDSGESIISNESDTLKKKKVSVLKKTRSHKDIKIESINSARYERDCPSTSRNCSKKIEKQNSEVANLTEKLHVKSSENYNANEIINSTSLKHQESSNILKPKTYLKNVSGNNEVAEEPPNRSCRSKKSTKKINHSENNDICTNIYENENQSKSNKLNIELRTPSILNETTNMKRKEKMSKLNKARQEQTIFLDNTLSQTIGSGATQAKSKEDKSELITANGGCNISKKSSLRTNMNELFKDNESLPESSVNWPKVSVTPLIKGSFHDKLNHYKISQNENSSDSKDETSHSTMHTTKSKITPKSKSIKINSSTRKTIKKRLADGPLKTRRRKRSILGKSSANNMYCNFDSQQKSNKEYYNEHEDLKVSVQVHHRDSSFTSPKCVSNMEMSSIDQNVSNKLNPKQNKKLSTVKQTPRNNVVLKSSNNVDTVRRSNRKREFPKHFLVAAHVIPVEQTTKPKRTSKLSITKDQVNTKRKCNKKSTEESAEAIPQLKEQPENLSDLAQTINGLPENETIKSEPVKLKKRKIEIEEMVSSTNEEELPSNDLPNKTSKSTTATNKNVKKGTKKKEIIRRSSERINKTHTVTNEDTVTNKDGSNSLQKKTSKSTTATNKNVKKGTKKKEIIRRSSERINKTHTVTNEDTVTNKDGSNSLQKRTSKSTTSTNKNVKKGTKKKEIILRSSERINMRLTDTSKDTVANKDGSKSLQKKWFKKGFDLNHLYSEKVSELQAFVNSSEDIGYIIIKKGAKKSFQAALHYKNQYYVSKGSAKIDLIKENAVLREGDKFDVPQGQPYIIKNLSQTSSLQLIYLKSVGV